MGRIGVWEGLGHGKNLEIFGKSAGEVSGEDVEVWEVLGRGVER